MIKLARPSVGQKELDLVERVFASGHLTQGPMVAAFEDKVAAMLGVKHAIATSSCTTALHLALLVSGVKPGDIVFVSDYTFPASVNVIVHVGAIPVTVDIDLGTLNMDPDHLARLALLYQGEAVAVMPVHAFGCPADLDPICQIAHKFKLIVIEDAACALGAKYLGQHCGTLGDLGCFSFHPRKIITTGEGGMLVTSNGVYATLARQLRSHGGLRVGGRYVFEDAGYNYRMSDVAGAIGCAQMERLRSLVVQRYAVADRYNKLLVDEALVSCPSSPSYGTHAWQAYVVLVDQSVSRDAVMATMRERGVETTIGTYAFHAQPYALREWGYTLGDCPRSLFAYQQALALPLYLRMSDVEIRTVVAILKEALRACLD